MIDPFLVDVMRSCSSPISAAQLRLVADGRRHAAEQRRHFRARLREAENVVDEQQHVLAFGVAEVLGDGQRRQADAQARARRLGHLAVDQRRARLASGRCGSMTPLSWNSSQRSLPSRVRSPTPANTDTPPCFSGDVVDQLHDDDGLADAGAAEQSDLAALQVRLEQVDDLDAGLEHLAARSTAPRASAPGGESASAPSLSTGPIGKSTGSPSTFSTRPSVSGPTGTVIGLAEVDRLHAALHAVGRLHRDRAHAVLAEVLLDFGDDVDPVAAVGAVAAMRSAL